MLQNGGQPLVEEELQAEVIGADGECLSPQIQSPMTDGVDEADEFALVCCQLGVSRCYRMTEERDGPSTCQTRFCEQNQVLIACVSRIIYSTHTDIKCL
jgi:hypothetical protein